MNPLTAVCFILSVISLLLLNHHKSRVRRWGAFLSIGIMVLAVIKLIEYLSGWHIGVDRWIFNEKLHLNQMAPNTAFNFLLIGCALLSLRSSIKGKFYLGEGLLFAVGLISFFALIGYVYDITSFMQVSTAFIPMALNTSVAFILFIFAVFCSAHHYWLTNLMSGDGVGSSIARRFLPLTFIPVVLSLLRLYGQKMGLFTAEFGIIFFTICAILIFAVIILYNAELFNEIDAKHQQAEAETQESEARLKLALKGGNIGVWDWNVVNNTLTWDELMYKIYGIDPARKDLSYEVWESIICPNDRIRCTQEVQKAIRGEKDLDMEFRLIWADGSVHYIKAAALVLRDEQGKALRMIGMNWDTTEIRKSAERFNEAKQQAEEAKIFLDSIIENIPNMIFVKDAKELRFVRFNKAGEQLLGIPREQMLGKNDYDFFPKEQADFFIEKDRETLRRGQTFDIPEEYIDTATGKKILHTKKVTIRDEKGEPKYLLGISDDVTDIKQSEKKLKETLKDLERSNKELEQFAYVASHDLQEPLRTVASFCQLLEKRYKEQLDDKAQGYINYAVDGAKRMQVMIDDLLSYARGGKKDVERTSVDLNAVLKKIIFDLDISIKETGATIRIAPLPVVIANTTQMTQLFLNLLTNAIKFRGKNKPVIEIEAHRKDYAWEFVVKDNGIGISEEYFDQIFVIFQRLHSRHSYSGTGIGLALCKKIVENYGGRIWVKSTEGQGTAFYFELPV